MATNFRLFFLKVILAVGLLTAQDSAWPAPPAPHGRAVVPDSARVPNTRPPQQGTCWWVCAEMVGKVQKIDALKDLHLKVIEKGIGYWFGADDGSIAYWMSYTGVWYEQNKQGNTNEGAKWVAKRLDAGKPVIACIVVRDPEGILHGHAILLTEFDREKNEVDFVDPNFCHENSHVAWSKFVSMWTGQAYAFDPKNKPDNRLSNGRP